MSDTLVTYELSGPVALIGLNRVEKRNAMNGALFSGIQDAVARAQREANVGVFFGHGEDFSAGLDLQYAVESMAGRDPIRVPSSAVRPFDLIARSGIPFVAALKGAVVGAGFELAAAAHVRVADDTAYFGLPEGQRGIFVGGGGSVRIQRLIGYGLMADLMLTGRLLKAREAKEAGAVQYLTEPGEDVRERALALATRIAGNAPRTNWAVVNVLPRIGDLPDDEGLFIETMTAQFVSQSEEAKARIADFLQKRARPLK